MAAAFLTASSYQLVSPVRPPDVSISNAALKTHQLAKLSEDIAHDFAKQLGDPTVSTLKRGMPNEARLSITGH